MLCLTPDTHHALLQNVSKEAEKTAANIAEAAPVIGDRVSDRIGREAEQLGNEIKPAAEKAAKRISSEAEQLGKEARPMADKASDNIEAGARQVGEQARPAADNASEAMRKTANDASGETKHYYRSCQSCVLCLKNWHLVAIFCGLVRCSTLTVRYWSSLLSRQSLHLLLLASVAFPMLVNAAYHEYEVFQKCVIAWLCASCASPQGTRGSSMLTNRVWTT